MIATTRATWTKRGTRSAILCRPTAIAHLGFGVLEGFAGARGRTPHSLDSCELQGRGGLRGARPYRTPSVPQRARRSRTCSSLSPTAARTIAVSAATSIRTPSKKSTARTV